ncbi:hypothetical protein AMTRI_Chr02g214590 [Amborella trichopoda]|uniref:Uncharacterized protein n=1 Tax=Amborella trichopoda TaxID=13333 RepID=U5DGM5_AMBTC|nr:hypothetical protein AMTR_s00062p00093090 [Amborella trichopoda]
MEKWDNLRYRFLKTGYDKMSFKSEKVGFHERGFKASHTMYRGERDLETKDGAKSSLHNNNRGERVVEAKAEAPVINHKELINKYGGFLVEEKFPARPRGGAAAAMKQPEQPKKNNGHLERRGFFQPRGAWF